MPTPEQRGLEKAWRRKGRGHTYERQMSRTASRHAYATEWEARVIGHWQPDGLILDAGAGTCRLAGRLSNDRRAVVALDPSLDMLQACPAAAVVDAPGPLRVAAAAGERLPFPDASFDHVYCIGVLHFYARWMDLVRPLAKLLKPGGTMVFALRSAPWFERIGATDERLNGMFDPGTVSGQLEDVGLHLEACIPGPLLSPSNLVVQWADGADGGLNPRQLTYSVGRWLDRWLRGATEIQQLVSLELLLGGLLAPDAARQAVLVAGRNGGLRSPAPSRDRLSGAEPDPIRRQLRALWQSCGADCRRHLVQMAYMISRFMSDDRRAALDLPGLLPGFAEAAADAEQQIKRALAPGLAGRAAFHWANLANRGTGIGQALANRIVGRFR